MSTTCTNAEDRVVKNLIKLHVKGASLVVQWLRVCLAMQGPPRRSLYREDSTCRRATKPECHN